MTTNTKTTFFGIPFLKVQGIGNDFVLIDAMGKHKNRLSVDWSKAAPQICNRNVGVGADGVVLVQDSSEQSYVATMTIINSDGSHGGVCGNALRCVVKYVVERKNITPSNGLVNIQMNTTTYTAHIQNTNALDIISVDLPKPAFNPKDIPMSQQWHKNSDALNILVNFKNSQVEAGCVSMGNPHCVIFTNAPKKQIDKHTAGHIDLTHIELSDPLLLQNAGSYIETHEYFPEKTNVEFVEVLARDTLKVDVWERGVGKTLACGSGACAAFAVARLKNYVDNSATIKMPGGELNIQWNPDTDAHITMAGHAEFVFEGVLL